MLATPVDSLWPSSPLVFLPSPLPLKNKKKTLNTIFCFLFLLAAATAGDASDSLSLVTATNPYSFLKLSSQDLFLYKRQTCEKSLQTRLKAHLTFFVHFQILLSAVAATLCFKALGDERESALNSKSSLHIHRQRIPLSFGVSVCRPINTHQFLLFASHLQDNLHTWSASEVTYLLSITNNFTVFCFWPSAPQSSPRSPPS